MTELLMKGSPPRSIGVCSANGCIDSSLYMNWLNHFVEVVKPTQEKRFCLSWMDIVHTRV